MAAPLLAADEPPAFIARNIDGASPLVLLCEHASNRMPRRLGTLGLPHEELRRHIAWDIGAASLARLLSAALDAPLFETGYSRLAIDCNRPPGVPASIPERSEDTVIPGNVALGAEARREREDALFHPFQKAVATHLDARQAAGRPSAVIGVHSFTPVFRGVPRPWEAGILFGAAQGFAAPLIEGLASRGFMTGENEPYRIEIGDDYSVPFHGDGRGLPALLIEIRQDLLADNAAAQRWAGHLIPLIRRALDAALSLKERA